MTSGLFTACIAAVATLSLGAACVQSGADTYDGFRGAVDAGAPCKELFDIRDGFDERRDLERIDADLEEIGCDSPGSTRDDF